MANAKWRSIKFSNACNAPLLLSSFRFSNDGYSLYFSDLVTMWSENLTRKQIIRRSIDENTSIDPTESSQQYLKLLEVIDDGLSGKDSSSVRLYRSDSQSDHLTIIVINELPPPLSALLWPLHLKALGCNLLKEKLFRPILDTAVTYSQQVKQLKEVLEDKDRIISRLLDRVLASGADLASIFPTTSGLKIGKRADVRSQLAPYVKGLGNFASENWSVRPKAVDWNYSDFSNELQQVLSDMPERQVDGEFMKESSPLNWTAHISLLDTNEVERIDSMKVGKLEASDSSIINFSSITPGKVEGQKNSDEHGEQSRKEKRSHLHGDKLLADKVKLCAPLGTSNQDDENLSEPRKVVIKKLGTIGGTDNRRHETALYTVATDEAIKGRTGPNNVLTNMQEAAADNPENVIKVGNSILASRNGTDRSENSDANVKGNKVHNRIGGISKPICSYSGNDKASNLIKKHPSKGEELSRQRDCSSEWQRAGHAPVTPGLSAEEKANKNREKLKQETKGQHPVPMKKRRKF